MPRVVFNVDDITCPSCGTGGGTVRQATGYNEDGKCTDCGCAQADGLCLCDCPCAAVTYPCSRGSLLNYTASPMSHVPDLSTPALNEPTFGMELEGQFTKDFRRSVKVLAKWLAVHKYGILKSDSTTGDGGFELCTVPMTLKQHTKILAKLTEGGKLWKLGVRGFTAEGCGIHVHTGLTYRTNVDEEAVFCSPGTFKKVMSFLFRNGRFCQFVGQRGGGSYSHFRRDYDPKNKERISETDKYQAVNYQANRGTSELRIFRSNIRLSGILKNLQFTHALYSFCRATAYDDLTVGKFLRYIRKYARKYKELIAFCSGVPTDEVTKTLRSDEVHPFVTKMSQNMLKDGNQNSEDETKQLQQEAV